MQAEFTTTFWSDFGIADVFGADAVRDTFDRAFAEWKSDYRYLTSLVMTLNHKCFQHDALGNIELRDLYIELYEKANDWAWGNLKGEELRYYYEVTD